MCRVYKSKAGSYVRLCHRFGPRRGERIPFAGDPPLGPSGHYAGPPGRRPGSARRKEPRRCLRCGSPVVSRHEAICGLCRAERGRKAPERSENPKGADQPCPISRAWRP